MCVCVCLCVLVFASISYFLFERNFQCGKALWVRRWDSAKPCLKLIWYVDNTLLSPQSRTSFLNDFCRGPDRWHNHSCDKLIFSHNLRFWVNFQTCCNNRTENMKYSLFDYYSTPRVLNGNLFCLFFFCRKFGKVFSGTWKQVGSASSFGQAILLVVCTLTARRLEVYVLQFYFQVRRAFTW